MATEERWRECWALLGVDAPSGVFDALVRSYTEPEREYHTLDHLRECFAHLDAAKEQVEHPGEVALALWFHDAIYDTHAFDNEGKSAEWVRQVLSDGGISMDVIQRVMDLVLVTQHAAAPQTPDQRLMSDIDLAILGADPARFDTYEDEIRREYAWVDDEEFRTTRRGILKAFLDRPSIYLTPYFHEKLEANARRNLARSLEKLAAT